MTILIQIYLIILTCLNTTNALLPNIAFSQEVLDGQTTFDWSSVTPSHDLRYHECYQGFECARLQVPLDWNNASNPYEASLAVIRLPAVVPVYHATHGGTIFLNPGGPGGSGVQWALQIAKKVQRLLDGTKHYEILSFDPRGIFRSMPNAYCFDDAIQSEIWSTGRRAVGGLNDSVYALQYGWASHEARGQLCAHTDNGKFDQEANLRQHVSTAYVARDMLAIAEKVEQHKLANEQILLAQPHGQQRIREQRGHSSVKLQYIGTSYGTFLGQTFAAMYPEHVGRFVLDGNVDGDNWVSKHELGIEDNAEARNYFFARCFAAAVRCAFFRSSDQSPSDVEHRFESLLSTLDEAPYPMAGFGYASPITKSDVLSGFMTTAYQPLLFFSLFAEFLDDLYTDQPLRDGPFWLRPVPTREVFADDLLINRYQGGETGPAVHCSDGPDLSSVGLPEFQRYMENLTATYGWAGAIQAEFKLPCWTWPSTMRTKWRYAGPFSYPRNSTSRGAPILFVNNRVDPVCSVKNAERAARKYRGSVVLIQDAVGHGALWPAGKCVWDHVKSYFDDGVLPENGTVCPAPCEAFGTTCDGVDLTAFDKGGRWWWH